MADSFDVTILTQAGPQTVNVEAKHYEQDERGNLNFFKGEQNNKVASFRTWDYVVKTADPPP
jgi:hypothetical protein